MRRLTLFSEYRAGNLPIGATFMDPSGDMLTVDEVRRHNGPDGHVADVYARRPGAAAGRREKATYPAGHVVRVIPPDAEVTEAFDLLRQAVVAAQNEWDNVNETTAPWSADDATGIELFLDSGPVVLLATEDAPTAPVAGEPGDDAPPEA